MSSQRPYNMSGSGGGGSRARSSNPRGGSGGGGYENGGGSNNDNRNDDYPPLPGSGSGGSSGFGSGGSNGFGSGNGFGGSVRRVPVDFSSSQQQGLPSGPASTRQQHQQQQSRGNSHSNSNGRGGGSSGSGGEVYYGVIISIKEVFGFIQPLTGTSTDHVYFSLRDISFGISLGDEVSYQTATSVRGLSAVNIKPMNDSCKIKVDGFTGLVLAEEDYHRSSSGRVELKNTENKIPASTWKLICPSGPGATKYCCFANEANSSSNNTTIKSSTNPKFVRDDEVSFSVTFIPNTGYCRAFSLKLQKTKKERLQAEQIENMLAAGVKPEQGIVRSVKKETNKSSFGFIQGADRMDDIFFKFDDVIGMHRGNTVPNSPVKTSVSAKGQEEEAAGGAGSVVNVMGGMDLSKAESFDGAPLDKQGRLNIEEGQCVEFFCIMEMIGGRMSNKAVHIKLLPPGSIVLETVLHTSVAAVVTQTPSAATNGMKEKPGVAKLVGLCAANTDDAVGADSHSVEGYSSKIELWPRCMTEALVSSFKIGDEFSCDVHYYRPQKMYFARNIALTRYRTMGREYGYVCKVMPKESNYGFIASVEKPGSSSANQQSGARSSGPSEESHYFFRCSEVTKAAATDNNSAASSGKGGSSGSNTMKDVVEVAYNTPVSFEVVIDNLSHSGKSTNGAVPKYRAVRVQIETDETVQNIQNTPFISTIDVDDKGQPLQQPVYRGIVVRETRKETNGQIKIQLPNGQEMVSAPKPTFPAHMIKTCVDFLAFTQLSELSICSVSYTQRLFFHHLIEYHTNPANADSTSIDLVSLAYEMVNPTTGTVIPLKPSDNIPTVTVRLFRITDPKLYDTWYLKTYGHSLNSGDISTKSTNLKEKEVKTPVKAPASAVAAAGSLIPSQTGKIKLLPKKKTAEASGSTADLGASTAAVTAGSWRDHSSLTLRHDSTIPFAPSTVDLKFGSVLNALTVQFQVYLDCATNTLVARNVALTDEAVPGSDSSTGKSQGIISSISPGSNKNTLSFGFIRVMSTDEKLFWQYNASGNAPRRGERDRGAASTADNVFVPSEGLEVSFSIRLRGGTRCAVSLSKLPKGSLSKFEMVGPLSPGAVPVGRCIGVVVTAPSTAVMAKSGTTVPATGTQHVVLFDTSRAAAAFQSKYVDIQQGITAVLNQLMISPVETDSVSATAVDSIQRTIDNSAPKLYAPLFRQNIPICHLKPPTAAASDSVVLHADSAQILADLSPSQCDFVANDKVQYSVGDIVECSVLCNNSIQRSPVAVCGLNILSSRDGDASAVTTNVVPKGVLVNGRVVETKIKVDVPCGDQQLELCHLTIDESSASEELKALLNADNRAAGVDYKVFNGNPNNKKLCNSFFCDQRDLLCAAAPAPASSGYGAPVALNMNSLGSAPGTLGKGDIVKFIIIPNTHIAIGSTVQSRFSATAAGSSAGSGSGADKPRQSLFGKAVTATVGGVGGSAAETQAPDMKGGVNKITMAQVCLLCLCCVVWHCVICLCLTT